MIADDVQVVINGLYHPNAGDLNITLRHNGKLSSLISKRQDGKSIGFPRGRFSPGYKETEQDEFGLGQQFIFRDPQAENMALRKNASQSSTLYSAEATRAVDGIVDGRLSHESLSHTDKDINSWLQVDLGENQTIGIVKLWNREAEILVHEIQRIWTQAFSAMHGTFRLQLGYQGINATTGNIHHNAVPRIENEIGLPGSGAGQGESMQSMIQSLSNIGQVEVSRVGPTRFDEFEWRITFISETGDVPEISILSSNFIGESGSAFVHVETVRNGTSFAAYRYNSVAVSQERRSIEARIAPCWVMLFYHDIGDVSLQEAKEHSLVSYRFTVPSRELVWVLTKPQTARYVRIQLENRDYLHLAEVEVFPPENMRLMDYRGGSPIQTATLMPETSLNKAFQGLSIYGDWTLSIADTEATRIVEGLGGPSDSLQRKNGLGGIGDWVLLVRDMNGDVHEYRMDLVGTVETLPTYGRLYFYNSSLLNINSTTNVDTIQEQALSDCYEKSCDRNQGLGHKLSTSPLGSIARPNYNQGERLVLFVPLEDYIGEDSFTYSITLGVTKAPNSWVYIHVINCRRPFDPPVGTSCKEDIFVPREWL